MIAIIVCGIRFRSEVGRGSETGEDWVWTGGKETRAGDKMGVGDEVVDGDDAYYFDCPIGEGAGHRKDVLAA